MNLHWTLPCFWCWLDFSRSSVSTSGWDERNSAQSASLGLDEACHQICSFSFSVGSGSDERLQFLVPAASVPIPAVRLSPWCIVKVAGLIASFCRRTPCKFSCYIDSLIGIMDEVNHPLSRYDIFAWFSLWANCSFFCASTACGGWCELTHMHVHVHVSVVDVWRDCCLGRHLLVSAGGESETGETNKLIDVHISWHLGIPSTTFKQNSAPFILNYKTFQQFWRVTVFYIWPNLYNKIITFII